MPMQCDVLIVGAGFAGCVLAERLASQNNKRCIVVDRRSHIGGNAFDSYNSVGVLVHNYGPHYFRTNSKVIIDYLSKFTDWHHIQYKILAWTNGQHWQFPINLNTFEQLVGRHSTSEQMENWLKCCRIPINNITNSEEVVTSQIGLELFEMFYKNYTRKQWNCEPKDLSPSVCGRIPIRTNRDNRYLTERFQALPKNGYTKMFQKMLQHDNIQVLLGTDFRSISKTIKYSHIIYTGPIDEFYDRRFGQLPYRSLRFEEENLDVEYYQPVVQVNYPNDFDFTRIVEIKHATGQKIPITTIIREYPVTHSNGNEPYYPIPTQGNETLYGKYAELALNEKNVSFVGRLATYKYYNMDQVVGMALTHWKKLADRAIK